MDVYSDPRVKAIDGSPDGEYEVHTSDGGWAVFPQGAQWHAGSYFRKGLLFTDLGPYESRDAAIQAILDRY